MDNSRDTDPHASPRKRLKTQHPFGNDGMQEQPSTTTDSMADEITMQDSNAGTEPDKETECGITEYIDRSTQGFRGTLKKRYTDFLVNEILPSGQVVHLDELKAPKVKQTSPVRDQTQQRPVERTKAEEVKSDSFPHLQGTAANQHEGPVQTAKEAPTRPLPEMEPSKRQKHRVIVRQTEHGIEEITQEQMHEARKKAEEAQSGLEPAEERAQPIENTNGDSEDKNSPTKQPPIPSTTQDWQAYAGNSEQTTKGFELTAGDRDKLTGYFGPSTLSEILALYDRVLSSPHRRAKEYGSVKSSPIINRSTRTAIHQDLRRVFQSRLESSTDDRGAMLIAAASQKPNWNPRASDRSNNQQRHKGRQSDRPQWRELGGEYLHFTLYKENKDTMEAISWLARQLKMQPRSFQFAGTKDRRGVTVQRVSAHRVMADRMMGVGRTLRQAKVGNFQYQPHELRLGDLTGNEFVITLRDCQFSSDAPRDTDINVEQARDIVAAAVSSLRQKGFINYFGLQRFGTFAMHTDSIGMKILQGDFQGAVEGILSFPSSSLASASDPMVNSTFDRSASEDRARAFALNSFKQSGKTHVALAELPRKFTAEASIMRHLGNRNQQNDHLGALNSISRNLRLMYVHAYQSLVWNVMAGTRWRKYGSNVVEGDLVLVHEHSNKDGFGEEHQEGDVDADGEIIVRPDVSDTAVNAENAFTRARVLSKEEAESGRYTIFDIVLPTPGFDVIYPPNELGEDYKTFMASQRGGELDPHDMRRKWKDFSLSGSYRKLLARPNEDIHFEVKAYEGEDEQFVETDLDRLQRARKDNELEDSHSHPRPNTFKFGHGDPTEAVEPVSENNKDPDDITKDGSAQQSQDPVATNTLTDNAESEDGGVALQPATAAGLAGQVDRVEKKIAVIITMQLGSSTYATMALRELMGPGGVQIYKPDFGGGR